MENTTKLICKRVLFYSHYDEDAFFEWIKKISNITECNGVLDEIHLFVKNENVDRNTLREINALFKRYKIDRKQLVVFLNNTNQDWFKKLINIK